MNYYEIVGLVVVALIAIISFSISIRKTLNDDRKPLEELNTNIIKLNANFQNMLDKLATQEKRLNKHGDEIEEIINNQRNNEMKLERHELRIERIEKHIDI